MYTPTHFRYGFVVFKNAQDWCRLGAILKAVRRPSTAKCTILKLLCIVDVLPAWHNFWRELKTRLPREIDLQKPRRDSLLHKQHNRKCQSRCPRVDIIRVIKMMRGFQSTTSSRQSSSGKFMFKPIQVRDWCEWAHGEIDREQQLARPYRCAGFLCTELLEALSPFDEKLRIVFRKMFSECPSLQTQNSCTIYAKWGFLDKILQRLTLLSFFLPSKQRERIMSPVQTFQRVTSGGIEEIMAARPYGIQVSFRDNDKKLPRCTIETHHFNS